MATWMWLFIIYIGLQRFSELKIAKRNEKWMKERGGIVKDERKYKWVRMLHFVFYFSILFEVLLADKPYYELNVLFLFVFIVTQLGRRWCIRSMGNFWNTKGMVLPRVLLLKKGPYKYTKYPDRIVTLLEMFVVGLLFEAYITAVLYSVIHILLLKLKTPREKGILTKASI